MQYFHADVFSSGALSGNGLTVIISDSFPENHLMQRLASEFKQFETIFLVREGESTFSARIFTVEEELDFAGHPILGAAAVISKMFFDAKPKSSVIFKLNSKTVFVESRLENNHYICSMNQGKAQFLGVLDKTAFAEYLQALNLKADDLPPDYPPEIITTGLPYLVFPIKSGLENAAVTVADLEQRLAKIGAKFAYIFDISQLEGRTWDNLGIVEDVATGSAAGSVGAYLYRHGVFKSGDTITLKQGRFVGRPSEIAISQQPATGEIIVSGRVDIIAQGNFL